MTEDGKTEGKYSNVSRSMPDLLLSESVQVRVIVGRTRMSLQNIVKLAPTSALELDPGAASQVEVAVNGRVIAWGEVISVHGNYGVRMTRIARKGRATDR